MQYRTILNRASCELCNISGRILDIIDVKRPTSTDYAIQLSKVISKLSPLIGNLIEFSTVGFLNELDWSSEGKWIRQDPGFPDALFKSSTIMPNPGIEIKAWFPFATEITARFKDSVSIFEPNHINVALIAWLPEYVIFGKPKIIDVLIVSGKSIAEARDTHYHNPPHYLVLEPEDTTGRTGNLQQTNTNGYKFQEERSDIQAALDFVRKLGKEFLVYKPNREYQDIVKSLQSRFTYRLDTNYAKIDRIEHPEIESFKDRVLQTLFQGKTIKEWSHILTSKDEVLLRKELESLLTVK